MTPRGMTLQPMSNKAMIKDQFATHPVNTDISIDTLYSVVESRMDANSARTKQQVVGSYICRINNEFKRHGKRLRIVPGTMRRTYKLTHI
jgi:hypothetical protein